MEDNSHENGDEGRAGTPAGFGWLREALLGEIGEEALAALADAAERRVIPGGRNLVEQGNDANAIFFVQTGRFRVLVTQPDGAQRMVAEVNAGEPVGELAFFGGGKRTATVQAARDSIVLALGREAYDAVAAAYPGIVSVLLGAVSRRLAAVTARTPQMEAQAARVIAVLPAGNSNYPKDFVQQAGHALQQVIGTAQSVTAVAEGDVTAASSAEYERWLQKEEERGGYVLVDARGDMDWSRMVCRNADALVMVADAAMADSTPSDLEEAAFNWIWPENRTLVMLRETSDTEISGTLRWMRPREPHLHLHLARDVPADMMRLARFLGGCAVGLVLAGGGALGCAHLGIVQGLRDAGVPIDYIGGTSAGAAMGAAIAQGNNVDATLDQMEDMFVGKKAMKRLTVPVHSLLDPRVFDAELKERYSTRDITDQQVPFFAISTNLTTNDLHVHDSGPLWEAVRASGSLPTILPPFIDDAGNILVDGGVLDNIPVLTMRARKAGPNIVVMLNDAGQPWRVDAAYDSLRSRGQLLRDVVLRRRAPDDFPKLVDVMQRSMVVSSRMAARSMLREGDILLSPPIVDGMRILDWHLGRKQADIAADYVAEQIAGNASLQKLITE
ncbi:patatin-like phospholipase family protein [Sphingorhabdus sp. Alg239-R122]|uniref:patatin-like phospholipase family protein n=1 Tax=Sphingorhabdus sp. Alg239-R122 TaxID=2305989 RepID=UPI0013DC7601|nr:patatin-like phospholipase family protein [Sphingorhabdus sp. Alg239-R122]